MKGNAIHTICRFSNGGVAVARGLVIIMLVAVASRLPAAWAFCSSCPFQAPRCSPPQSILNRGELMFGRPSSSSLLAATTISSSPIAATTDLDGLTTTQGKGKAGKYDWSFLDAVYLITCPNADPNSTRLNKAKGILSDLGLIDKVEIKEFDTDDDDRIRGCYTSHISVISDAMDKIRRNKQEPRNAQNHNQEWWQQLLPFVEYNEGGNSAVNGDGGHECSPSNVVGAKVMILEDNFEFSGNLRQSSLDALDKFACRSDKDWNVIHLSYIPYVPNLLVTKTDEDNIVKLSCGTGSALGTTAYIISEAGMESLLNEDKVRGYYAAIPDVMAKIFPGTRYASHPVPFLRAPKTPSLVNPQFDDLRLVLFQPGFVSVVQSVFVSTGLSSNALLISSVVILLVMTGLAGRVTVDAALQIASTGTYEGNMILPVLGSALSLFSLGILAVGAATAPKPPPEQPEAVAE